MRLASSRFPIGRNGQGEAAALYDEDVNPLKGVLHLGDYPPDVVRRPHDVFLEEGE